jgi:peptide/nickel transport system permease protein
MPSSHAGARPISMTVGIVSVSISAAIGTLIGLEAGYVGAWVDNLLMRFTEVIMTFPVLFSVIVTDYVIAARATGPATGAFC